MRLLLALFLTSCGYQAGDLDRALECADGCSDKEETVRMPEPEVVEEPVSCSTSESATSVTVRCTNGFQVVVALPPAPTISIPNPPPATCTVIRKGKDRD